jgi:hypothetical protein
VSVSDVVLSSANTPVIITKPMKRSRFLAAAGATVFGFATKMVIADQAQATHEAPYAGCYGCNMCDCCVSGPGCSCCDGNGPCYNCGCPTNPSSACWYSCVSGNLWKCCDFHQGGVCCICRQYIGSC